MDILLDNPLATMDGPYFLILYGFIIFFSVITLAIIKRGIDKTDNLALPPIPSQIDPFEIAYLRGGTNEVARSVVFSLMQKDYVEITGDGATVKIKRVENSQKRARLTQIEELALNWIGTEREAKDVFNSYFGLVKQLEPYGLNYHSRLEQGQMLSTNEMNKSLSIWKWAAAALIFFLGLYKIAASIAHGYFNFFLTIVFGAIGLIIVFVSASYLPRLTKLGKAYLERLQLAFDNLKYEAQKPYIPSNEPQVVPQTTFAGVDPLLLSVGVFGSAILAGTVFDSYNHAFNRVQQQNAANSSSCSSGCGSSCSAGGSSCSSGDSGSSCSGGSSCGGGCGGGGCS